jgi:6-phosphogluconolactonase (cycloisomerase 2 family)
MIREVPIFDAYTVNIQFSRDGKYFAVLRRGLNNLQIYDVINNNIEDLLERVSNKEHLIELNGLEQTK